MTALAQTADLRLPPACTRIEIHVGEMRQLFNAMDPAPFRERDLDPKAEEFIVDSGQEASRDLPLALIVHLSQQAPTAEDATVLRQAVHEHFIHRASATRVRLQRLFRVGRVSLLIGILFVAAANIFGDLVIGAIGRYDFGKVLKDSFAIGSWVALWRPLEIFLYDWWPIRDEARLFDRLSAMEVRVIDATAAAKTT